MTTPAAAKAKLLLELKNVQYNAQNDGLKQRAKEWLFENLDQIINALTSGAAGERRKDCIQMAIELLRQSARKVKHTPDDDEAEYGRDCDLAADLLQSRLLDSAALPPRPVDLNCLYKTVNETMGPCEKFLNKGWNACLDQISALWSRPVEGEDQK